MPSARCLEFHSKENGYSTPMETYMTVPNVYSEDEVGFLSVLIEPEISWNAGNKFIYVYCKALASPPQNNPPELLCVGPLCKPPF